MILNAPTTEYPWPTITLNHAALIECVTRCRAARVTYGLGAKAPLVSSAPGTDFRAIDCSGFARWAVFQASNCHVVLPDGSANQHDWVSAQGFKVSDVESAKLSDGRVRIAFLSPEAGGGVGHVVMVVGGLTIESHGGIGPDRRPWTGEGWQGKCNVYVLA